MRRKFSLSFALLLILLGTCVVSAEISVGVKQGDWIEYLVTYSGTPAEGHDVTWARMEIVDVQGKSVNVKISAKYSNATEEEITVTLNLETGQLGDDFIIPANLKVGDTFFDKNAGNITINGVEDRAYAGGTRTVVSAATPQTTYHWDKVTGILVEGNSTFNDYSMNTKVDRTNMWQPQILGMHPDIFYALLIVTAIVIAAALALVVLRRKK
jgi:hypothetical protein